MRAQLGGCRTVVQRLSRNGDVLMSPPCCFDTFYGPVIQDAWRLGYDVAVGERFALEHGIAWPCEYVWRFVAACQVIDSTKREIRSCNLIATLYINIMIYTVVPITAVTEFLMTLSLIRTVQLRGLNEGDVSADSTVSVQYYCIRICGICPPKNKAAKFLIFESL